MRTRNCGRNEGLCNVEVVYLYDVDDRTCHTGLTRCSVHLAAVSEILTRCAVPLAAGYNSSLDIATFHTNWCYQAPTKIFGKKCLSQVAAFYTKVFAWPERTIPSCPLELEDVTHEREVQHLKQQASEKQLEPRW